MKGPGKGIFLLVGAIMLCVGSTAGAQEGRDSVPASAGPRVPEVPTLYLLELSVYGPQNTLAARELRGALSEWWEGRAASRLHLADLPGSTTDGATAPAALRPALRVSVQGEADRRVVEVSLLEQDGREARSRATVFSTAPGALAAALGGEILGLWARSRGYPEAAYAPPRLTALLELSALSALEQGLGSASEPLDCAVGLRGPLLLFTDRTVGLGRRFELIPGSLRDLVLRDPMPEGFVPSRLAVDPWGEPIVYGEGTIFRYRPEETTPDRSPVPMLGAQDAAGLPGGGMAVLSPGRVSVLSRVGRGLDIAEIPLPSPFWVALSAGSDGALWLYDLEERRIRVLDYHGGLEALAEDRGAPTAGSGPLEFEETGSVRPLVSPETLPFPQVLQILPDGGFILGGAGELWGFDPAGWPLWRLREFGAGVRQSLPAFYRVAVESQRAFYLLDPLSRRLLRFVDLDEGHPDLQGEQAPARFAAPPAAADVELAGLLRRWTEAAVTGPTTGTTTGATGTRAAGQPEGAALIEACLARNLLLMVRSLFPEDAPLAAGGGPVPDRTLRASEARLLSELGGRYAEELLLSEAEAAYNAALRILRALRSADPVDPEFPVRIREVERRRNAVREILVAVPPLELLNPTVSWTRSGGAGGLALTLQLRNLTGTPMRNLRYQVSLPGLPSGLLVAEMPRLAGGSTATLNATLPGSRSEPGAGLGPATVGAGSAESPDLMPVQVGEDLPTRVLVLVTATAEDREQTFWLESSIVVPPGELAAPPRHSHER